MVEVVERLIAGIRSKGPEELIDMSNVAQVRMLPMHACCANSAWQALVVTD